MDESNRLECVKKGIIQGISNAWGYDVEIKTKADEKLKEVRLGDVKFGEVVEICQIPFIVLVIRKKEVYCITKNLIGWGEFDKETNNFHRADVIDCQLKKLFLTLMHRGLEQEKDILPFPVDLTTDDGRGSYRMFPYVTEYGYHYISLMTAEQYRYSARMLEEYPVATDWWLATAESFDTKGVKAITPQGIITTKECWKKAGIRPVMVFNSDIIVKTKKGK